MSTTDTFDVYFDLRGRKTYKRLVWFPGEQYWNKREDASVSYFFSTLPGETIVDGLTRMKDSILYVIGQDGFVDSVRRAS